MSVCVAPQCMHWAIEDSFCCKACHEALSPEQHEQLKVIAVTWRLHSPTLAKRREHIPQYATFTKSSGDQIELGKHYPSEAGHAWLSKADGKGFLPSKPNHQVREKCIATQWARIITVDAAALTGIGTSVYEITDLGRKAVFVHELLMTRTMKEFLPTEVDVIRKVVALTAAVREERIASQKGLTDLLKETAAQDEAEAQSANHENEIAKAWVINALKQYPPAKSS